MLKVLGFLVFGLSSLSEGRLTLFTEEKTWLQSRLTCEKHGGQLALAFLNFTGNLTAVKSKLGFRVKGAWIGSLKSQEPIDHYPPNRTVMADATRYECGYVIPVNVSLVGFHHRLTASYIYTFGSKPCGLQEDYMCMCHPDKNDLLLVKRGEGSWRDVYHSCVMHGRMYPGCGMWEPDPSGVLNVTMAGSVNEHYLRVNHTYWIRKMYQLNDLNVTDEIDQSTRCGMLTESPIGFQFSTCSQKMPFICDVDEQLDVTTTGPDNTHTTQQANQTTSQSSGQGRQLANCQGTFVMAALVYLASGLSVQWW